MIGFTFVWLMLARLIVRPDSFAQRTARRAYWSARPAIWKNGARGRIGLAIGRKALRQSVGPIPLIPALVR